MTKQLTLQEAAGKGKREGLAPTKWAAIVVEVLEDFDPIKLVRWANRRGLVRYVRVAEIPHAYALQLDKALFNIQQMQQHKKDEEERGEDPDNSPDFYEELGF